MPTVSLHFESFRTLSSIMSEPPGTDHTWKLTQRFLELCFLSSEAFSQPNQIDS